MENKNQKKLTIAKLQQDNARYSQIKKIKVIDGYYLNIRKYISNEDMTIIFEEFGNWVQDNNVMKLIGDKKVINYLLCFVIKQQSDLFENVKYTNNIELFNIFEVILNCPAIDNITSAMDKNSLAIVYAKFSSILDASVKIDDFIKHLNKSSKKKKK